MTINPFSNSDIFLKIMCCLSPQDICRVGGVSRSWQAGLNQGIRALHKAYDLPRVEGGEFNLRNFAVLATMGFSQQRVRALYTKYIGEPIGPSPFVTKAQIEELCKPDPDQPRKRKFETHRGVILFSAVKRSFGKKEKATLDKSGQLTITETEDDSREKELVIPISIFNVAELFNHPKPGRDCPVFTCYTREYTPCIETSSIVFVRCEVPEGSRDKAQGVQKNRLPGTPISSLLPLMISCGFDILDTGTCSFAPTSLHRDTCARTSDGTFAHGDFSLFTLGGFIPGKGVVLGTSNGARLDCFGAVPMIPPEGCSYSGSTWDYLISLAKYAFAFLKAE